MYAVAFVILMGVTESYLVNEYEKANAVRPDVEGLVVNMEHAPGVVPPVLVRNTITSEYEWFTKYEGDLFAAQSRLMMLRMLCTGGGVRLLMPMPNIISFRRSLPSYFAA
jgi:hypothetical protein